MFSYSQFGDLYVFLAEGRAIGAAAAVSASGKIPLYASNFVRSSGSNVASKSWITGLLALPAAGFRHIV